MFFVEEFNRLSAQMHRYKTELEEMLAPQKKKMAVLQAQKEEAEMKIEEKKDIGNVEEKDFEEEEQILTKIEKLRAVEQEKKESFKEDFDLILEKIIGRGETESHLIGKAIGVSDALTLELRCPLCGDICSEDNQMVLSKTSKGSEDGLSKSCLECSDKTSVKVDEESAKKIEELSLIKHIIGRLESVTLSRTRIY